MMAIENPGSFNDFVETHSDIPETDRVTVYSGKLAAYHTEVAYMSPATLSPDFMLIQGGSTSAETIAAKAS